ncbi:hypothetical protein [Echinimonas agarilytica]|uniref:Uncharacterized protein n=1 Tax=Echinimonas agarilytica TaxID=1215918 RepID=A0AA41WAR9_9GAMM|nr:hypothetical protein [Echinimonas agarilytica]MCM2681283.1 hypothetical protein [Echinimonas agarilytica]
MRFIIAFIMCTVGSLAFANNESQVEFNKIQQGDQTLLSFVWRDSKHAEHYIKASINTQTLVGASRVHKRFRPRHLNQHLARQVKFAETKLPSDVKLRLVHSGFQYHVHVSGNKTQAVAETVQNLDAHLRQTEQEYLAQRHLVIAAGYYGGIDVIPDYKFYTHANISPMMPFINAFRDQIRMLPPHLAIERVASFVQSIPVKPATGDITNYDPPLTVLLEDRADAHSKATLAASIIRGVYPTRPLALIHLTDHALIGVQINYPVDGRLVNDNGAQWLVAEVSTPEQMPIGKVMKHTERELSAQAMRIITIP